jgi:hypothetical protein
MNDSIDPSTPPDLESLRKVWTPINDAHRAGGRFSDGVHLRIYRCLSWMDRAAALEPAEADLAFILRMIGYNALWGRVVETGERSSQIDDCRLFLEGVATHDHHGRLLGWMRAHEDLLGRIFESRFFHREWWKDPDAGEPRGQDKIADRFSGWLADGDIEHLAREFARRMQLLRGQLVHGNATHGGKTNRPSVEPAAEVLDGIVRTVLAVLILDGVHAVDLGWMPVPYPPTPVGDDETSGARPDQDGSRPSADN